MRACILKLLALSTLCCTPLSLSAQPDPFSPPLSVGTDLEDFYTAALEFSPHLNIAFERWNVSSARKDAATGQLLPNISATGSISENDRTTFRSTGDIDSNYRGERYGLQMSQVLFNWQAFSARGRASLQENQAEAEYYAQVAVLLADVADRYLAVLQAEDVLRSIESEFEAVDNQVNQLQALFDRQLVQITELYDAQARLAAVRADQVRAQSDVTLAREALRALTNLQPGSLLELPEEVSIEPLEGSVDEWLQSTQENNQLIEARTYAYEAADKQVAERRGALMPNVSLVVQQQNSNLGFDNALNDEYETFYVGLNFQMPIFSGGTNMAGVREAQGLRSIAQHELRQAQLEMVENARTAYLQVRAGEARIEAAQALLESTDTSYRAMQRGFELRTVTSVDLLNSLRDRFQAERELQTARYEHLRARLVLQREAGVLTAEDLLEISNMLVEPNQ